jgi:hypothetical protein
MFVMRAVSLISDFGEGMFDHVENLRAAEWQSMKWLTEDSNPQATIVSISKPRKNIAVLVGLNARQISRLAPTRSIAIRQRGKNRCIV